MAVGFLFGLILGLSARGGVTTAPTDPILPVPTGLKQGFYAKCVYFRGLPILASEKVDDKALRKIVETFNKMLAKVSDAPIDAMIKAGSHYSIIGATEQQLDLPEYADMRNDKQTDWNKRARGLGGLITSGGEENILELPSDRYKGECIFIHEFSHTLADFGFAAIDKTFRHDLQMAYSKAMSEGLWKNTYSATNPSEYWAEGVQCYFDCCRSAPKANGVHNEIYNRVLLKKYDPRLFRLVDRSFGRNPWRYEGSYNTTHKLKP